MIEPVKVIQPEEGKRYYGCALCREEIPDGCKVIGDEKRGKLVGVTAWRDGTLDDGKTQGLVVMHSCGTKPGMPADVQQHHDTLRGLGRETSGVELVT